MLIASRISRSRAISLPTLCELWGRNSSGSTRDAVDRVDVRQDDLERPLEDLGLTANTQVIPRLERPRQFLRRVPQASPDAAGLVAELELEVEIPLAIGPELFVGDEEHFFDRVAMSQLIYVATAHSFQSFPFVAGMEAGEISRRNRFPSRGRL